MRTGSSVGRLPALDEHGHGHLRWGHWPEGSYQFLTNTGSVNVTLPENPAFHVDASTDTGSVWTDFPGLVVQHPSMTSSEMHGDMGSTPQATLTLRTNTGPVSLHRGI